MRKILFFIIVGVGAILTATSVPANALTFNLNFQFSNLPNEAAEPVGSRPWLTATFEDIGPNQVQLTMAAPGLTGDEFVSGWYFNFDPNVTFNFPPIFQLPPTSTSPPASTILRNPNGLKADGILGEGFDLLFNFPTASANRFEAGEIAVYQFLGIGPTSLTAESFNFLNEPEKTDGLFRSAAHVQAISNPNFPNDDSGWIATNPIPEPGTILLLGAGLVSLFGIRRFKFKKN